MILSPDEQKKIVKEACELVRSSPISPDEVIKILQLMQDLYMLGYNIEFLLEKSGLTYHENWCTDKCNH